MTGIYVKKVSYLNVCRRALPIDCTKSDKSFFNVSSYESLHSRKLQENRKCTFFSPRLAKLGRNIKNKLIGNLENNYEKKLAVTSSPGQLVINICLRSEVDGDRMIFYMKNNFKSCSIKSQENHLTNGHYIIIECII